MIIRDFDDHALHHAQGGPDLALCAGGKPGHRRPRPAHRDRRRPSRASATPRRRRTWARPRTRSQAELELFRPLVLGQDPHDIEAILIALDRALRGAPQAKAAIDCALHELKARALGVPLNALFGGQVRDSVPILRILAIKTPSEMAAAAQKLVDKGYRYLKIKVHGEVEEDVARVAAIRKQVGDDVHLTIDANQSYTPKDAIAALNRMAEYRIDLCRAAGRCRRLRGPRARHPHGAGDGRGRRGGGLAARDLRACVAARGRCGEPEDPEARRPAQHARGGAALRGRRISSIGSAPRSAAGCCPRRRCILPARCRASTMPASLASSTGCSTIRSRGSRSRTACSSCRGPARACGDPKTERWRRPHDVFRCPDARCVPEAGTQCTNRRS